jgi:hypothetical protein
VGTERYACPRHWFSLPRPLRQALWDAYRRHGPLSPPHLAAMAACDAFLHRQRGPAAPTPGDAHAT